MKKTLGAIIAASLASVLVYFGYTLSRREYTVYTAGELRLMVPKKQPTYGLPLAEYVTILKEIRSGDTNQALRLTEGFLDLALLEAKARVLSYENGVPPELKRSLEYTAGYRRTFKRFGSESRKGKESKELDLELEEFLEQF